MAGFGAGARAGGSISVVSDNPNLGAAQAYGQGTSSWLDTSSASFWALVWFALLVGVIYAVFHGLLF
jgi:hypothetical protein